MVESRILRKCQYSQNAHAVLDPKLGILGIQMRDDVNSTILLTPAQHALRYGTGKRGFFLFV
jgi:hypothetical protein